MIVADNDTDFIGDSLILTVNYSFEIIDDDTDAPIINLVIIDDLVYNNATSFVIGVNATDYSGIDSISINFNGDLSEMTNVAGLYYVTIPMPVSIGNYSFEIIVNDADFDRFNDALTTTENYTAIIEQGTISEIEITIDFIGFNLDPELGINMVSIITANLEAGSSYSVTISISNGTLLYTFNDFGTISPLIYALNNYTIIVELEIAGEQYCANLTVELAEQNVKDLITQELDVVKRMINDSESSDWKNCANIRKLILINKLELVEYFIDQDTDETAYHIMLIIKAKLTGELTDEYNDGVFGKCHHLRAWIENEELQEEFLMECNSILWALTLCF